MASVDKEAIKRLQNLSECCVCLMTYTDPRILPCFHTACFKCFEDIQTRNKKKPREVLLCPLCRKKFTIPPEGMKGLQKNFFIESLMEVINSSNLKDKSVPCTTCSMVEETSDVTEATMRCLKCCENYCSRCSKMHKSQKATKDHKVFEIRNEYNEEEIRNMFPTRNCKRHPKQELNYYCSDCKTVVCVSCFVEDHQTHRCKDVTTVDKEFRRKLEENCEEMTEYSRKMLTKKMNMEKRKKEYLEKTLEIEKAIRAKREQLKSLIDQHTNAIMDELYLLKKKHEKQMETEIEEIESKLTVIESIMTYSTEVKSKGSASEVCGCADNLITRAKELSEENEEYLSATSKLVEVKFFETDQNAFLQNIGNVIGKLSESTKEIESFAIVIGGRNVYPSSYEVIKINLNRSEDVSNLKQMPSRMQFGAAAAVDSSSIFVTGVGDKYDEIWRFDATYSSWKKCASMVKGRQYHSVAFVYDVVYLCGGVAMYGYEKLDGVEAYDTNADKCTSVGKLCYALCNSGNCVPLKASLYIFGGLDANNKATNNVQVYDTKTNTCSLLSKPMPRASIDLRAAFWENYVILFGHYGFFIYNFDSEIWKVRDQFKIDSFINYGMTVHTGKIFLIGGFDEKTLANGNLQRFYGDDVRYIPVMNFLNDEPIEWIHYAKLPKPLCVCSIGKIDCCA